MTDSDKKVLERLALIKAGSDSQDFFAAVAKADEDGTLMKWLFDTIHEGVLEYEEAVPWAAI